MSNELIIGLMTLLAGVIVGLIKIYKDVYAKLKELEVRLDAVERRDDQIYVKLDRLMDAIQEVKIELQNKQNR
jgi:hypothetical protein